jgi:hypothetical protein
VRSRKRRCGSGGRVDAENLVVATLHVCGSARSLVLELAAVLEKMLLV